MKRIILLIIIIALAALLCLLYLRELDNTPNLGTSIYLIRGDNALADKQYSLAEKYFFDELATNPSSHQTQYKYGRALVLGEIKNITKAIESYKKFILDPRINEAITLDAIRHMQNLGMTESLLQVMSHLDNNLFKAAIMLEENVEKAYDLLQLIPEEQRQSDYYTLAAKIHFSLGMFKETIKDTDYLVSQGHENAKTYYLRAQSFMRTQQSDLLRQTLVIFELLEDLMIEKSDSKKLFLVQQLINDSPFFLNNQNFNVLHVNLLLKNRKLEDALKYFGLLKIEELTMKNRNKLLSTALKMQVDTIFDLMYVSVNKNGISSNNISSGELINYCQYFFKKNELDKAYQICRRGVVIYPHVAPLRFWLGMISLQRDYIDESIKHIEKAIYYAPWVNIWRIKLAQIYLTTGQTTAATQVIKNAIIDDDPAIKNFIFRNGLMINDKK